MHKVIYESPSFFGLLKRDTIAAMIAVISAVSDDFHPKALTLNSCKLKDKYSFSLNTRTSLCSRLPL